MESMLKSVEWGFEVEAGDFAKFGKRLRKGRYPRTR